MCQTCDVSDHELFELEVVCGPHARLRLNASWLGLALDFELLCIDNDLPMVKIARCPCNTYEK